MKVLTNGNNLKNPAATGEKGCKNERFNLHDSLVELCNTSHHLRP